MNNNNPMKTDIKKVEAAMLRARDRAHELARRTKTPIVVYEDGEVKEIMLHEEDSKEQK